MSAGETIIYVSTEDGSFSDKCELVVNDELSTTPIGQFSQLINIYPNPAKDRLYFEFSDNIKQHKIKVSDTLGRQIYQNNNYTSGL